ncbi:tRNA (N(6)-L-threonylcarbamoyladenosine(37)-C(2))-methylthiotransferase MtaB [Herbivorax sp. ANBcel31]|uniref:tRNA (N(6)-L-threonylcarbamoyladenosine(37)-C(2))- methylthiotransferase MtaB n=1 Tax=Herbivorax sp. ANBcel31 TaxID=3069754 RepID=UPI0027B4AE98|nr:tRNA (N(6)-L-threonylcarbamoyladenosine(37)-C(2))-methylthiotransferase MtaB [Herbivorax sp. ANBcel31]MDQ2087289.1 tRNA (N(6)-L-threonylcarbamoyladenosine(37)-C(2))-methylthiotransferase MtaB [Herbivorax sp. ANBcel31]
MKTVAFYTLGCKVNQYETQAITNIFENAGYNIVDFNKKADVYLINTCTVTNLSDRKSRQMIRRAKKLNGDSIVVVVGCYAQTAPEEVSKIEGVNLIVGTKERSKIIDYINEIETKKKKINVVEDIMNERSFEEFGSGIYKERTRAFIKIQEGCNQFCSYCIIPYARGPIRSRSEKNVVEEVKKLLNFGYREIVLTGIHIGSYGKDKKTTSLIELIKKVHEIDGIERIRLGSIEPNLISEDFVNTIKNLKKMCPHYHVSLQSGCDSTLERMNRKYTTLEYKKSISTLRREIEDVAISTDVMVGFPGETTEEFEKTYKFLDEISFSGMHVFKYSPRKGTPAASFESQVSPSKKEERSNRLFQLSKEKTVEFNKRFIGDVMPVLFEQKVNYKHGYIEGFTPNYIKVLCKGDENLKGQIVNVSLKETVDDFIIGKILDKD